MSYGIMRRGTGRNGSYQQGVWLSQWKEIHPSELVATIEQQQHLDLKDEWKKSPAHILYKQCSSSFSPFLFRSFCACQDQLFFYVWNSSSSSSFLSYHGARAAAAVARLFCLITYNILYIGCRASTNFWVEKKIYNSAAPAIIIISIQQIRQKPIEPYGLLSSMFLDIFLI